MTRRRRTVASTWLTSLSFPFLYVAPAAAQQHLWHEAWLDRLPPTATGEMVAAACAADFDGDGDLDVVLGMTRNDSIPSACRFWRNDGRGVFADGTATSLPITLGHCRALAAVDVEGDGDLDVVQGTGNGEQDRLWLNDGAGRFADVTASRLPAGGSDTTQVLAFDLDGDRDVDLVLHRPDATAVLVNDGRGAFTVLAGAVPASGEAFSHVAGADVDGDGDVDLVEVFTSPAAVPLARLLRNDGSGRFAPAPATDLPVAVRPRSSVFLDADGDRDLDLGLGHAQGNVLLRNDGAGRFAVDPAALPGRTFVEWHLLPRDIDGDGDLDLVCAGAGILAVFTNDGTGRFTDASAALPRATFAPAQVTTALAVDLDGHTGIDLLLCRYTHTTDAAEIDLVLGDGRGGWRAANAPALPHGAGGAVDVGDLDGDRLPDVVTGGTTDAVHFNAGDGSFRTVALASQPPADFRTQLVRVLDVDRDGDLDLLLARVGRCGQRQGEVLRNDGRGNLLPITNALQLRGMPVGAAFGDLDGDGDTDVAFVLDSICGPGDASLHTNDGTGRFTEETSVRLPSVITSDCLALGDLDGDADLDLLFPTSTRSKVLLNDGRGFFQASTASGLAASPWVSDVAIADIDGDGRQDVVELVFSQGSSQAALNRGNLAFQAIPLPASLPGVATLTVADVDLDDRPDLVLGSELDLRIARNLGSGQFVDLRAMLRAPKQVTQSRVADLDLDGDADLLLGGIAPRIYRNGLVQLAAPYPFDRGHDVVLRTSARRATANRPIPTALALALGRAHIAWESYGIVQLDPRTLVPLPTVTHFDGNDIEVRLRLPRHAALAGLDLNLQGFVADLAGTTFLHLSAAPRGTVR